ncbi:MAG: CDP-diacylglycerol--glycerol-3-phosphate 3-phosphatidyltransferase [Spirochaetota bacterium]|nr:CDP-diacylglycerol--glycerol-3-phosphate 3-phosphatidyltransferase [Spirochaetota bacterium]
MNIPNCISVLRIVLIPLFLYLILLPQIETKIWALIIFCIASFTDLLDGWTARRLGQETATGKFLDPIADKFLVISALIAFLILDKFIPLWMVLIIVGRDILITYMRYLAIKKKSVLKTSRFGKIKTVFQMISIIIIIMVFIIRSSGVAPPDSIKGSYPEINSVFDIYMSDHPDKWLIITPYFLMAIVTLLTAFSGIRYIITNRSLLIPDDLIKSNKKN